MRFETGDTKERFKTTLFMKLFITRKDQLLILTPCVYLPVIPQCDNCCYFWSAGVLQCIRSFMHFLSNHFPWNCLSGRIFHPVFELFFPLFLHLFFYIHAFSFFNCAKHTQKMNLFCLFCSLMKGSETDFELREGVFDHLFSVGGCEHY